MQSKNVLWLGLISILLLTVFCIARYINAFHPNIETITQPTKEVIDQTFELEPVQIANISKENETQEVDENYLNVVKLIEQEEKDIQDAYNKALREEEKKSLKSVPIQKSVKKVVKQKIPLKAPKKLLIETVLANQTLVSFGKLSYLDKQKLKKIVHNFKIHPSSYLRIESNSKNSKFYSARRYLASLGVSQKDIQVLRKPSKSAIVISHSNNSNIEISLIKKD